MHLYPLYLFHMRDLPKVKVHGRCFASQVTAVKNSTGNEVRSMFTEEVVSTQAYP